MSKAYRHEFELAGLPRNPNDFSNGPGAWKQRHFEGERWKKDVWAMCAGLNRPPAPLLKARITMTRIAFGKEPDRDNLAFSFKPVMDGLIYAKVIADDNPATIESVYRWEPGKYRKGLIRILIEEIP